MKILLALAPYVSDGIYPAGMNAPTARRGMNLIQGPTPPLGLLYIAAALKKAGHQTAYFEGAFYSIEDLKRRLAAEEPDLIGFTVTAPFWPATAAAIKEIRTCFPRIKIAVGGKHVDLAAETVMSECAEVDYACFGDGEIVLPNLCACLARHAQPADVKGVAFRKDGNTIINRPETPVKNLDDLPFPDYDLLEFRRYSPSIGHYLRLPNMTMIGSRGCPHRCLFCNSDGTLRERSIPNILAEIELLVEKYGVKDILFYDEDLTGGTDKRMNSPRLEEFCRRLIERKYDLTWSGNARADHVAGMDVKTLELMKKAGCWKLLFGLESGVQKNINTLRKGFTVEQARHAVEKTARAGIRPFCVFMFGIPGETYEEGLETVNFARSLKGAEFALFLNFTPYPGSEAYKQLDSYGRLTSPLSEMTTSNIVFVPHTMTGRQLQELYFLGIKSFYRRPAYILQRLLHTRSFDALKQNIRGFRAFAMAKQADV